MYAQNQSVSFTKLNMIRLYEVTSRNCKLSSGNLCNENAQFRVYRIEPQ
jgi:hypothetical protein